MGTDDATNDGLLRRQQLLQLEADAVLDDLDLTAGLEAIGDPIRTGSSALGVMVKPDIDMTTVCTHLDLAAFDAVAHLATRLARHDRVRQVTLRNDTGDWNTEPDKYPDGLFLQVQYRSRSPRPRDWSLDLWFVDHPERQPDLGHLRTLLPRLTDETREAILRIKEEWTPRPEYGRQVNGILIYEAVLDGGVRTLPDFAEWLAQDAAASKSDPGRA